MNNIVQQAEIKSKKMAIIFIILAFILIFHVMARLGEPSSERLYMWFLLLVLTALNLTQLPVKFLNWRKKRTIGKYLNDELTQNYRLQSYKVGFWVTFITSLIVMYIDNIYPITGIDVARILVTTSLVSALLSRAILELKN